MGANPDIQVIHSIIKQRLDEILPANLEEALKTGAENRTPSMTIIATKGTLDWAYPPFILSSTAAALGWDVSMFFTFYGLELLKKDLRKLKVSPLGNPAMPMKMPMGPAWFKCVGAGTGEYYFPDLRLDAMVGKAWLAKKNLVTTVGLMYADSKSIYHDLALSGRLIAYFPGVTVEGGGRVNWSSLGDVPAGPGLQCHHRRPGPAALRHPARRGVAGVGLRGPRPHR